MTARGFRGATALSAALLVSMAMGLGATGSSAVAAPHGTLVIQFVTPDGKPLVNTGLWTWVFTSPPDIDKPYFMNSNGRVTVVGRPGKALSVRYELSPGIQFVLPAAKRFTIRLNTKIVYRQVVARVATITGTVRTTDGSPLVNSQVVAYLDGRKFTYGFTNAAGTYVLRGLRAGQYRVIFNDRVGGLVTPATTKYTWSYWRGATTFRDADAVTVRQQSAGRAATAVTNSTEWLPWGIRCAEASHSLVIGRGRGCTSSPRTSRPVPSTPPRL